MVQAGEVMSRLSELGHGGAMKLPTPQGTPLVQHLAQRIHSRLPVGAAHHDTASLRYLTMLMPCNGTLELLICSAPRQLRQEPNTWPEQRDCLRELCIASQHP